MGEPLIEQLQREYCTKAGVGLGAGRRLPGGAAL